MTFAIIAEKHWRGILSEKQQKKKALFYELEIPRIVHPMGYSPREMMVDRDIMGQFYRNEGACRGRWLESSCSSMVVAANGF